MMRRTPTLLLVLLSLALTACAPAAAPSPTAAPAAKPPEPTKPGAPAASPAASPSPVASPAGSPAPSPIAKPAAGPLTKVKVSQAVSALSFVTVYVGRHRGFYAEEGLDVEQLTTGGTGPDTQALLSGDVEFNITPGTTHMDTFKQGRRLLLVFNALDKNIINMVMHVDAAREKGITTQTPLRDKIAALRGLKIGATRPGALTFQMAEYYVNSAGLKPQEDVQIVGAGEGAALIAALESRQVDAFLTATPVPEQAIARGRAIMLVNNAAGEDVNIVPFNMSSVLVTPDYAEKNPEMVGRFVRASRKANEWIAQSTPEQIADAVSPDFGQIQRDVLVAGATAVKAAINRTGVLEKRALQTLVDMTQSGVNVDELYATYTDRFLR